MPHQLGEEGQRVLQQVRGRRELLELAPSLGLRRAVGRRLAGGWRAGEGEAGLLDNKAQHATHNNSSTRTNNSTKISPHHGQDAVGEDNSVQAMRNGDGGALGKGLADGLLNQAVRLGVRVAGGEGRRGTPSHSWMEAWGPVGSAAGPPGHVAAVAAWPATPCPSHSNHPLNRLPTASPTNPQPPAGPWRRWPRPAPGCAWA
jgi:hypothetical protein